MRLRGIALFGAGLLLGSTAGLVSAAIPSSTGTYTACYETKTGIVHLIDSGATCPRGQQGPVTWNEAGEQGPAGPQGSQGPVGPQGPAGPVPRIYSVTASQASDTGIDSVVALCNPHDIVVGGGGAAAFGGTLRLTRPYFDGSASQGWAAAISSGTAVYAYAMCEQVTT